MCKVSIVVPVYNAHDYIERCVKSIQNQTFDDFELILVDDGSKDDSFAICQNLSKSDKRIKVFNKDNGGASSARKYGVEKALGAFVTFVDVDDTIPVNAIYDLYMVVESSGVDIVQGERRFISIDGKETMSGFESDEVCDSHNYIKYLFKGYTNCGPIATLYRRTLFDGDTFNLPEDVKLNEDFYMNICLGLNAVKVALINKTVYNYIENNSSVTHNYSFLSLNPQKHLFEQIKKILDKHNVFVMFEQDYYSRLINSISSAGFHNRKLLKDPFAQRSAIEAKTVLKSKHNVLLCFMILNPWSLPFFTMINKIRQFILGYKMY